MKKNSVKSNCFYFFVLLMFVTLFLGACGSPDPDPETLIPGKCAFYAQIDFNPLFKGLDTEIKNAVDSGAKKTDDLEKIALEFKNKTGVEVKNLDFAFGGLDISGIKDFTKPPSSPPAAFFAIKCKSNPANDILMNLGTQKKSPEKVKIRKHDFFKMRSNTSGVVTHNTPERYLYLNQKLVAFCQTSPVQMAECIDNPKSSVSSQNSIISFFKGTSKDEEGLEKDGNLKKREKDFFKALFIPSNSQKALFTNISLKGFQSVTKYTLSMNKLSGNITLVFHADDEINIEKIKSSVLAARMMLSTLTMANPGLKKVVDSIKIKVPDKKRAAMIMRADENFVSAFLKGLLSNL